MSFRITISIFTGLRSPKSVIICFVSARGIIGSNDNLKKLYSGFIAKKPPKYAQKMIFENLETWGCRNNQTPRKHVSPLTSFHFTKAESVTKRLQKPRNL